MLLTDDGTVAVSPQVVAQRVLCDQSAGDGFLQGPEERQSGDPLPQRDSRQPEGRRLRGGAGLQEEETRLQAQVSPDDGKRLFDEDELQLKA